MGVAMVFVDDVLIVDDCQFGMVLLVRLLLIRSFVAHVTSSPHSTVLPLLLLVRVLRLAELLKVWEADVAILLPILMDVTSTLAPPHRGSVRAIHWTRVHSLFGRRHRATHRGLGPRRGRVGGDSGQQG